MKKEYRKPRLISAAEVDEIRKKIEQEKMIRRSLKRDGMTDEEIEAYFRMATEAKRSTGHKQRCDKCITGNARFAARSLKHRTGRSNVVLLNAQR